MTGARKRHIIRLIAPRLVTVLMMEGSTAMATRSSMARRAAGFLTVLAVCLALAYGWVAGHIPRSEAAQDSQLRDPDWQTPVSIPASEWAVFKKVGGATNELNHSPLFSRYRLAGTFFRYATDGGSSEKSRRAIVDDLQKKEQRIIQEGDKLDEFTVSRIFPDRVILRANETDYELNLSYLTPAALSQSAPKIVAEPTSMEEMPALESTRFGKRVGDNRWILQREELLKYYHDVLDEPERIAALYVSLKPDYQESEIAGYRLNAEGEQDFFKAVGLQENDVIRKVNSMRMVSQRRAEYFMSEFLKDRVSALVLDVEREGKPEKLIYLIR